MSSALGSISEVAVPSAGANPFGIAAGPDGNIWFSEVGANRIGRLTPAGALTEFATPTAGNPGGIIAGPDGALWFTEIGGNKIGRLTTSGSITEFSIPTAGAFSHAITAGSNGALWFTETGGNKIGEISTSGVATEFALPTANAQPFGITAGPDGNLWFVELNADKIGRITTGGQITEFAIPTANSQPAFIAAGPDGALWFSEVNGNNIGRITTSGTVSEVAVPTAASQPQGIVSGPDGALWFVEAAGNKIARLTTGGTFSEFALPTGGAEPFEIASGPGGSLSFSEFNGNNIGRIGTGLLGTAQTDLVYRGPDGTIQVQLLNGIAATATAHIANSPFDANWSVAGSGDFNGDGVNDLILRRNSDSLTELQFLNGAASAGGGAISNNPFDASWSVAAVGDFNGDGRSDIAWRRNSDGLIEIQLLSGTTNLGGGAIANNPFDTSWSVVASGDFTGNGKDDLVWRRASDGLVEIQFLSGNTAAGGGVIANNPFDLGWSVVAAGDFNGDGKADLVWRRASDGLVEIQFLDGHAAIGGGAIANNPFDASWNVVGTGDFNGDGKTDLVWQRASDGLVEVQFLDGTRAKGGGIIAGNPLGGGSSVVAVGKFDSHPQSVVTNAAFGAQLAQLAQAMVSMGAAGGTLSLPPPLAEPPPVAMLAAPH